MLKTYKNALKLLWALLFSTVFLLIVSNCHTPDIAGGSLREESLKDGVYQGRSRYGPVRVEVEVTVRDNTLADIELLQHFYGRGRKAEDPVIERILQEQSTEVDAVSGATGSSIAIMNAVEKALQKARED